MNNKDLLFFSLIIVFGVLPCLVVAFLIGKQKKYQLLSGWNPAHYSNPTAFANRVALSIFLLGLLLLAAAIIGIALQPSEVIIASLFIGSGLIPLPIYIYASVKFKKGI